MPTINEHYLKLTPSYLFAEIGKRVRAFAAEHPDKAIIRMGIGDVTEPLPQACVKAFHQGVDDLSARDTFKGYEDSGGYAFLRSAIAETDFRARGCEVADDEVFVSDGAKCDTANLQEIFGTENSVAIPDPVYPVYLDTNVMAGRTGAATEGRYEGVTYLDCTPENGYVPAIPAHPVDLIYLCFPNNPTGVTATQAQLQAWVDYALSHTAIILFDAAYEAFIRDESLPHSIYEIEGARDCAIEFRSFSKNAGFTGTRCAYTIVPKSLQARDSSGAAHAVHALYSRRYFTKFNGVSYPVQKAAAAVYTAEGKSQIRELTDFYLGNAQIIREAFAGFGLSCVGGDNSPYIWIETGGSSWDFFDKLLNEAGVVCTPGAGFGKCGEGHIRLSAFNSRKNVEAAMEKLRAIF